MATKKPSSREEAIKMMAKRQKKIENPSEDHLQFSIVKDYADKYPERRGCLIGIDNNANNPAEMRKKIGMGLVKGTSDMLLFQEGKVVAIELKTSDSVHDSTHILEQCEFIIKVAHRGGFCTSLDQFWRIHDGLENGICPRKVKEYIKKTKKKTVKFGDIEKWL